MRRRNMKNATVFLPSQESESLNDLANHSEVLDIFCCANIRKLSFRTKHHLFIALVQVVKLQKLPSPKC